MGHDAVLTAVRAIRLTRANSPEADAVIQQLSQIKETKAVLGASGCISLDLDGNPANKVIPILELKPDGSVTFVQFAPHHPLAVW